ncbi:Uma2 family endonuclease [Ectothiorhodospiraceae bacterium BW-2]|nr:Uma2 family endonuclease [Ectothiorhodospiraceae bacterium BW-2]
MERAVISPTRHLLSVGDYYQMAINGILQPNERVELLEGEIFEMAPIGSSHAGMVKRLNYLFSGVAANRYIVTVQDPLRLDAHSEPEPDLMLLRYRDDFYSHAHPTAADVLLLIEVADSTLRYEREVKLPLYAQHGVSEVWIINLEAAQLECYREVDSTLKSYRQIERYAAGQIAPVALPESAIEVAGLW